MKKRIFAALLALCLTALTGCDWSTADPEDIFGTLTDYYNVEQKRQDVKLTSFALPYLKGETADPITCPDGAMQTLGALLYEGLFALDGSFDPQPALAESYTYDAARYTYTITLRSGVTFSDGSAVTARDVVNSLRRAQSSARYSGRLAEVSDLRASGGAVRHREQYLPHRHRALRLQRRGRGPSGPKRLLVAGEVPAPGAHRADRLQGYGLRVLRLLCPGGPASVLRPDRGG